MPKIIITEEAFNINKELMQIVGEDDPRFQWNELADNPGHMELEIDQEYFDSLQRMKSTFNVDSESDVMILAAQATIGSLVTEAKQMQSLLASDDEQGQEKTRPVKLQIKTA